ncbi:MAG: deaminase [Patescibacteria group bacterium]|nr:deaminase [Patescibacteria group bacterium]
MNVKYPYLPESKKFLYVSEDNPFMQAAKETARVLSTDKMQSTGAVVVKDNKILGRGANQVLLKHPKLQEFHRKGFCPRKALKIKSGTKYWMCLGCSTNKDHAESQAIDDAKNKGNDTTGADLYLWGHWWCCKPCWDNIIAAGIGNTYLLEGSERLFNAESKDNVIGRQFN